MKSAFGRDFSTVGGLLPNFDRNRSRPRHRWYYYKEGFDSELVRWFLEGTKAPAGRILDPFVGSGTVLIEAARAGWNSVGVEVNPFAAFLATCKTTACLGDELRLQAVRVMRTKSEARWAIPRNTTLVERDGLSKWLFDKGPALAYESLRGRIEHLVDGEEARRLLTLAAIGAMADIANARRDGKCWRYRSTWRHLKRTGSDFRDRFRARVETMASDLDAEARLALRPQIFSGDSRSIVGSMDDEFDAVLTSPPYLNSFDYTDVYRPELLLLGAGRSSADLRAIRFKTIRSHVQVDWKRPPMLPNREIQDIVESIQNAESAWDSRIAEMINAYFVDLVAVGRALRARLKLGGWLGLVVADSAYCGRVVPVPDLLSSLLGEVGFDTVEAKTLREGRGSAHHQRARGGQLRESLLILRAT